MKATMVTAHAFLEAENRRLREALREIDRRCATCFVNCPRCGHAEPMDDLDLRLVVKDALASGNAAPQATPLSLSDPAPPSPAASEDRQPDRQESGGSPLEKIGKNQGAAAPRGLSPRDVAAYLLDRADQYETESPCWIALADVAQNIMRGEVEAAERNGDFDPDIYARADGLGTAGPRAAPSKAVQVTDLPGEPK